MFCPRCGSNENDNVRFCTNCGFMLCAENNMMNPNKSQATKIKDIANNGYTSSKFDARQIKHNNNNNYYQQNQQSYPNYNLQTQNNNYNYNQPQNNSYNTPNIDNQNNNYGYNYNQQQNNNFNNYEQTSQIGEVEATSILDGLDIPVDQPQNNNYNNYEQTSQIGEVEATSVLDGLDIPVDQPQNNNYNNYEQTSQIGEVEATSVLDELDIPVDQPQNNNYNNYEQTSQIGEVEATSVLDELDIPVDQPQNNNYNNYEQTSQIGEVEATSVLDGLDIPVDQPQNNNFNQPNQIGDNIRNSKYNYADLMNVRNSYNSSPMASSQESLADITEILDDLEEPLIGDNTPIVNLNKNNFDPTFPQEQNSQFINQQPQIQNNLPYQPVGIINPQNQNGIPVQQPLYKNSQNNNNKKQRSVGVKVVCGILSTIMSIILAVCILWINVSIIWETGIKELSKGEVIKSSGLLTSRLDNNDSLIEMFIKLTNIKLNDKQIDEFAQKSTLGDFIANRISLYNQYVKGENSKLPKISNVDIKSLILANIDIIEKISGETFTNEQIQTILNNIDNKMVNEINKLIVKLPISQSLAKVFNRFFIPVVIFVLLFLLLIPLMNGVKKAGLCSGIILTSIGVICLLAMLLLPNILASEPFIEVIISEILNPNNLTIPFIIEIITGVLLILVSVISVKKPERIKDSSVQQENI